MKPKNLQKLLREGYRFVLTMESQLDVYAKPDDRERALYDRREDKVIARYDFNKAELARRNGGARR